MIWGLGNSVACILFGIIACHLPTLRALMKTKLMRYLVGFMSIFQLWINMNGIREIFRNTFVGTTGGTIVVYAVCIGFILLLLRFGVMRNVLTDRRLMVWCLRSDSVTHHLAFAQSGGAYNHIKLGH